MRFLRSLDVIASAFTMTFLAVVGATLLAATLVLVGKARRIKFEDGV